MSHPALKKSPFPKDAGGPSGVMDEESSVDGCPGQTLHSHLIISLIRVLAGFSLACATAIPLGLAMGANRWQVFRHATFPSCLPLARP